MNPPHTSRTLVAFHAHPDDEALLTSGTMARAAAEGHRVVLVIATDGGLGRAADSFGSKGAQLAATRRAEVRASADLLGVARVADLGYADSGSGPQMYPDPPGQVRFARVPRDEAAERLAQILLEEDADVLLTYDRNGGYGHRDHLRVHEVGARAADLATERGRGVRVLEATIPRDAICRGIDLAALVYRFPPEFDRSSFDRAYSARSEVTHRISVRRHIAAKRASMRAHASQASANDGDRTLGMFLKIPRPLFDVVFGREWYRDPSLPPGSTIRRDIFEDLP